MELVYLWVEEYKNIRNQGFNFSPRFEFHYDKDSKKLTKIRDESTTYKSIFPDNINVTAIVGENGSGKSSILEALITLVSFKKDVDKEISFFLISADVSSSKSPKYYKKCINMSIDNKYEELGRQPLLYFNYSLDYLTNKYVSFDKFYHRKDDYEIPTVLIPSKKEKKVDILNIDYVVERNMLDFTINNNLSFENIEKFFTIKKFKLSKNSNKIIAKRLQTSQYDIQTTTSYVQDDIKNNIYAYLNRIDGTNKENDLELLNNLYILKKVYENRSKVIFPELKALLENDVKNIDKDKFKKILQIIKEKTFNDIFSDSDGLEKIYDSFNFKDSDDEIKENLKILLDGKISKIADYEELLLKIPGWVDIELFDEKDINLKDLSYGQKFLNRFAYTLLYQVKKIDQIYKDSPFIILLDEVELGLHPQLQKEFLKFILEILNIYSNTRFHIVFTSHSPFLLSDIPKENVIFLEKYKENDEEVKNENQIVGNCKNVSKDIKLKTFGANIHTLLSDGFFMSDGLMGEFAKGKINEIKDFYNKNKDLKNEDSNFESKKDEFKKIKNILRIFRE
jgi:predicted ATPase